MSVAELMLEVMRLARDSGWNLVASVGDQVRFFNPATNQLLHVSLKPFRLELYDHDGVLMCIGTR